MRSAGLRRVALDLHHRTRLRRLPRDWSTTCCRRWAAASCPSGDRCILAKTRRRGDCQGRVPELAPVSTKPYQGEYTGNLSDIEFLSDHRKVDDPPVHSGRMDVLKAPELLTILQDLLGPEHTAALETEWPRFWRQAAKLGLEVLECEDAQIAYAEGARRPGDWPTLARTHYGVLDILHVELPGDSLENVQEMLERARVLDMQGFGQDLLFASAHERTPESALIRFGMFQLIRVNLWLQTWGAPRIEALGAMSHLDIEAQRILMRRLHDPEMYQAEVRPLFVLVAEAFQKLTKTAIKLESHVHAGGRAFNDYISGLTEAAARARKLGPADAAILRNDYADHVDELKLGSKLLAERHPGILPSEGAIDTRRSRLLRVLKNQAEPKKIGTRIVDLTRDVYSRKEGDNGS